MTHDKARNSEAGLVPVLADKRDGRRNGMSGTDTPEMLTAKDLEAMLKIDVKTIYSYVERGLLPYVRIQSNLRFLKSEILKWIEDHRFRPKPPAFRR